VAGGWSGRLRPLAGRRGPTAGGRRVDRQQIRSIGAAADAEPWGCDGRWRSGSGRRQTGVRRRWGWVRRRWGWFRRSARRTRGRFALAWGTGAGRPVGRFGGSGIAASFGRRSGGSAGPAGGAVRATPSAISASHGGNLPISTRGHGAHPFGCYQPGRGAGRSRSTPPMWTRLRCRRSPSEVSCRRRSRSGRRSRPTRGRR